MLRLTPLMWPYHPLRHLFLLAEDERVKSSGERWGALYAALQRWHLQVRVQLHSCSSSFVVVINTDSIPAPIHAPSAALTCALSVLLAIGVGGRAACDMGMASSTTVTAGCTRGAGPRTYARASAP